MYVLCCIIFVRFDSFQMFLSSYRQQGSTDNRGETTSSRTATSSFSNSTHRTHQRKSDSRPTWDCTATVFVLRPVETNLPLRFTKLWQFRYLRSGSAPPPLQTVAAFGGPYYSPDTSLISITGASTDTADSGDNATCSSPPAADNACFTVAQMSTLNKIFDKNQSVCVLGCLYWLGRCMGTVIAVLPAAD